MSRSIEIFGWYGTIAIITAYALVSFSVLQPTSIWYQVLNGTGALGILVAAFHKKDYQPGVLNLIWVGISLLAILKIMF